MRSKPIRIPGMPASPRNSAYIDQPHAASVPMLMSVSMVAAPCLRFAHAARWNGQAPHSTTGVASWSANHCQLSNWSAGIIESSRTGSERTAENTSRRRSARVSSTAGSTASASVVSPSAAGSVAV